MIFLLGQAILKNKQSPIFPLTLFSKVYDIETPDPNRGNTP